MKDSRADESIKRMVQFIEAEAFEKAEEIKVQSRNEVAAMKASMKNEKRIEYTKQLDQMEMAITIKKRIRKSKLEGLKSEIIMLTQSDAFEALKAQVLSRLADVHKSPKYSDLIRCFIVEGLMKMMEVGPGTVIQCRCRKMDESVVFQQLGPAVAQFQDMVGAALAKAGVKFTNSELECKVVIDRTNYLPGPPNEMTKNISCVGGIDLVARGGKMILRNTLDARVDNVMSALMPQIRELFFPLRKISKIAWTDIGKDYSKH